jgi:hypothetical protein
MESLARPGFAAYVTTGFTTDWGPPVVMLLSHIPPAEFRVDQRPETVLIYI